MADSLEKMKGRVKQVIDAISKSDTGYGKIIITAILTAVLTSSTQYFLQNSRMNYEQEYWRKRYQIEYIDKLNTQKMQLIEDINNELLQLEITAKEIKIESALSKYFTTVDDAKNLKSLMIKYHKDLNHLAAKVQTAALYFGPEVNKFIPILNKSLGLNFKNNLSTNTSNVKLPELEKDFETIDTLSHSRLAIIKAMSTEIAETYKLKKE